jgi:hypothetical protein
MKSVLFLISLSLIVSLFGFTECSNEEDLQAFPVATIKLDTLSFSTSMKGWELYSWPNGDDWNYSILPGTNRVKSYEEVTTNRILVLGIDSLKMILDKLPENENIFWIGEEWLERCWGTDYGDLALPDFITILEIEAYCIQNNLHLFLN